MAYKAYAHGQLEDCECPVEMVHEAMTHLPKVLSCSVVTNLPG
jgi:hypothetical protein